MRLFPFAREANPALLATAIIAAVAGGAACVDSSRPGAKGAICGPAPMLAASEAAIPSEDTASPGPYAWKNVVIKGGGFVTGIVMSPALRGLAFARTDVGGAYRFAPATGRWLPVTDWAGHDDGNLTGIESIAVDPVDPSRVYVAAGQYVTAGSGVILASADMGQTWSRHAIGVPMGGNADGRSMGERLAVDPNLPSTLFFGSRTAGLWTSTDSAQTWTPVATFPTTGDGVYGLTFVLFDRDSGATGSATPSLYVGVGVTSGTALYRSLDGGASWEAVAGQPTGMMPHHGVLDGCGNITFAYNDASGPNNVKAGAVWRYETASGRWTNVSPPAKGGGFGGIAADAAHPGTLLVTTLDRWSPDEIYRTTDAGKSWTALGGAARWDDAGAKWVWFHRNMLSATGWMGDVEIDPFDSGRALYVTGQGIWSTGDLTAADGGGPTDWTFSDDGLEETVVLDLASPPAGVPLLSAVGDISGFRHDDLQVSPTEGMFGPPLFGNTSSLDFAESAPNIVARVGTASSNGGPSGAYSTDGGKTWTAFASIGSSGSIAVSADGQTFVWAPRGATPQLSRDSGNTWTPCGGLAAGARLAADRVNPSKLYAGAGSKMYVSTDGGAMFTASTAPRGGRPRPVFGVEGEVWVATTSGLFRSQDSGTTYTAVPQITVAAAVGFGMAAPDRDHPAVFVAGAVNGAWGVYRSDDAGTTWTRVDDGQHQFGSINVLTGDPRRHGRVYLGTAGRGILYGDPS